jgi:hypothetical protein
VPTLTQVYEGHAADCTRAAEQTDIPCFVTYCSPLRYSGDWPRAKKRRRNRGRKRLNALVEMPARRKLRQRNQAGVTRLVNRQNPSCDERVLRTRIGPAGTGSASWLAT